MASESKMNRRTFLETSSAAMAATIVPRYVLGGPNYVAPSDKVNIGYIGTGTQGIRVLMDVLRKENTHVAAICDVNEDSQDYIEWFKDELKLKMRQFLDEPKWGEGDEGCRAGRKVGQELVETYYAKQRKKEKYQGCNAYADFRELLEQEKDLDGVCILTPEHTHAAIAIAAMRKGKHVITHKPVSNVLAEVRMCEAVAAETKVATHMFCSADVHTTPLLCEWIWSGAIGQVREVHNWSIRPFWPQGMASFPTETPPIPEGFDWDLWLGPAAYRPYHPAYTHAAFRGWYDFGTGALGDMGHYSNYQIFKILKLGAPSSVEASRSVYWTFENGLWGKEENHVSFPRASMIHWEFPEREDMAPVTLHWYDGGLRPQLRRELAIEDREMPAEGTLFVGDKGTILAGFMGGSPRIIPEAKMKQFDRPPQTLPRPIDELDQWTRACQGGEPADARFEVTGPISEMVCLGNIALRVDGKLKWDAEKMQFSNSEAGNKLLRREYREGWELQA